MKECIKVVILEKAVRFMPEIGMNLSEAIKNYENIRLKSIFN